MKPKTDTTYWFLAIMLIIVGFISVLKMQDASGAVILTVASFCAGIMLVAHSFIKKEKKWR